MGCDISMYVEHRKRGEERWQDFGKRINPGRSYVLFGYVAGVRENGPPVVLPRGLPADLGWEADTDANLLVDDEHADSDGWCSRANADEWVKSGSSKLLPAGAGGYRCDRVTHPDWHSHTWLTADELAKAIELADRGSGYLTEYYGVLGAMRAMEARGHETRVVIWFDN